MKTLIKVILLAGIFIISSCGDDQTDRAGQQKQHAKKEQAATKVVTPVTSTEKEAEATITPIADVSSTIPPWAVLEQNVYYYPEVETSSLKEKAVEMVK